MTMSDAQGVSDHDTPAAHSKDDDTVAELRSLLLGQAEAQLAEVHERLFDPHRQLKEISNVLPDAIAVRSRQDDKLTTALSPTVSAALERSIRRNPQPLVDAIFPIMGPAIRKAIAAALGGMVQSFNQTLNYSMSARGLGWRWEALKTGRSFSEVVLLHTLLYRVEQIFLIHKESGLLLHHVAAAEVAVQDTDMVSGMLTAIQDFVQDSFHTSQDNQLETLQVGDLTVWIEQGPKAILAAVIRGNAPVELRETLQEILEKVHLQFGTALIEFNGDAALFAGSEPLLEEGLQSSYDPTKQPRKSTGKISPFTLIASLMLLGLLVLGFFWLRDLRRWNAYVERLRSEPGFVITDTGRQGGKYFVSGLRDPLSRDPATMLKGTGLDSDSVVEHWQAFQALSPQFVLARAEKTLEPPPGVKLSFNEGALEAQGFASHNWVVESRRIARFLPGVNRLREDKLFDLERIEDPLLLFDLDLVTLRSGQDDKLNRLVDDLNYLRQLAGEKSIKLEITGHTDGSGTEMRNNTLSQGRAETVAEVLKSRLPAETNFMIIAQGSKEKLRPEDSEADRATNRSVTIKVVVKDTN
jgi:outer membrane protein OmpA-like peptidoglycan-associated protein